MANEDQTDIVRNANDGRFELAGAPQQGNLAYREVGDELTLIHTQVDDDLEGQGIGSALVRAALAYAESADLTVVPECRFVAGWLDRHPDRAAELDIARR